jgi:sarcosine oxidase
MRDALSPLGVELRAERTTLHWFTAEPGAPALGAAAAPVLLGCDDGLRATAVFPALDGCVKVAAHHSGEFVDPETMDRTVRREEITFAQESARRIVPHGIGRHARSAVCLYTVTPHEHFIIDHHPAHPQVILASACNGFGFKFSAATGEALALLAVDEAPRVELDPWRLVEDDRR